MAKAKEKKPARKPAPKPRKMTTKRMLDQKQLPGMEEKQNPTIHAKALAYADVRDRRVKLSKEEDVAKKNLIAVMQQANIVRYKFRELIVDITDTIGVKVTIEGAAPNGEGEE